tara:strand:- start:7350 stop:8459 length:1110 start_codon:yes stop_codon:yes gene_type:complete
MDPKISDISEENDIYKFTLSNLNVSLANALRRTILTDIPLVVIPTETHEENKCNIEINTCRLHNEILKQRLSCIPIHIDFDQIEDLPNNYVLEVHKKNETDNIIFVTTEDFILRHKVSKIPLSPTQMKAIFPPDKITQRFIDFCRLRPKISDTILGEEIKFTAEFSIGTAKKNSMFNAVSKCAYGNTPDLTLIDKVWKEKEQKFKSDDVSKEDIEFAKKNFYLLDAERYFKEDSFDFVIKSVGVYENKFISKISAKILYEKFKDMIDLLEQKQVDILKSETTMMNCFDIHLDNEDYTIGKVIEYYLYSEYYLNKKTLSFNGFKKMHPHDSYSVLRMAFKEKAEKSDVEEYLKNACGMAKLFFEKLYSIL